jgi:hypothetical protein
MAVDEAWLKRRTEEKLKEFEKEAAAKGKTEADRNLGLDERKVVASERLAKAEEGEAKADKRIAGAEERENDLTARGSRTVGRGSAVNAGPGTSAAPAKGGSPSYGRGAAAGAGMGFMGALAAGSRHKLRAAAAGAGVGALSAWASKKKSRDKDSEGPSGNLRLLFWVAVCIQITDVIVMRMNRTSYFYVSIIMYASLALLALIFFSKEEGHLVSPQQIILFILISFFYVIVPTLLYAIPDIELLASTTLFDWVTFFLAILPIWPLYIGFKAEYKFVHSYVNFWIVFLLFVFIFGVGMKLSPAYFSFIGGRVEEVQFGVVANYLIDKVKEIGIDFWKTIKNAADPRKYALYNNSIGYYVGEIEGRNDKEPVGLYLDNIYAYERYFYKGYPAVLWADVRGKSFVDQITVTPTCLIDKVGPGARDPASFNLLGSELTSFSCTFTGLEPGSYTARIGAQFNFETWAYVTYTFVDLETRRSLEMQGKNINSELDIPSLPRSIYTPGPIMLGMSAQVDLPIGIDTRYNTREPVLGVTIDNVWSDGKPRKVNEFTILVPDDFRLVKCDRWYPVTEKTPDESEGGVDTYRFLSSELGDIRQSFQSVTCRLRIKDPAALLRGAQKVDRTFVTIAKYDYELEKTKPIQVKE